jgi:hypothetical protein
VVVGRHVDGAGPGVVEEGEGHAVLGADRVADDDLWCERGGVVMGGWIWVADDG